MRVEIREIPPYRIAYMRHFGPYGARGAIAALWTDLWRWIRSRDLIQPGMLTVGIGHDAPGIVAEQKLRYDAGVIVGEISNRIVPSTSRICRAANMPSPCSRDRQR